MKPSGNWKDWATKLDSILIECGKDGWDSYAAAAVTPEAVVAAKKLLTSLWITPTVNGGISVAWLNEQLEFELDSEGVLVDAFVAMRDANDVLKRAISGSPETETPS